MEEAERLCDRVIILDHGRIIAADTVANLHKRETGQPKLVIDFDIPLGIEGLAGVSKLPGVLGITPSGNRLAIELGDLTAALRCARISHADPVHRSRPLR